MKNGHGIIALAVITLFAVTGCNPGPRDIDLGHEECAHCKMTVSDARFAAELVTKKGRIHVYDAVECMAAAVNDKDVPEEEVSSIWVMAYDRPGTMIDAAKAWYLRHEEVKSPMGMNLAAYENEAEYAAAAQRNDGKLFRWLGVRLLVAREWE